MSKGVSFKIRSNREYQHIYKSYLIRPKNLHNSIVFTNNLRDGQTAIWADLQSYMLQTRQRKCSRIYKIVQNMIMLSQNVFNLAHSTSKRARPRLLLDLLTANLIELHSCVQQFRSRRVQSEISMESKLASTPLKFRTPRLHPQSELASNPYT